MLAALSRADLDEAIDQAFAEFCVLHDLSELLVEKHVRLLPVDFAVRLRKVEGHELGEIARDRVFPGSVAVVVWRGLIFHGP